jgi:hypothetical protein
MTKSLKICTSFIVAAVVSATAWAGDSPIGALVVKGKATITAQDTSFTLEDQEYAYFSGDRVGTDPSSRAAVTTSDGLKLAFDQSTVASITRTDGVYTIDLEQGAMAVDAREGVEYELTKQGEAVPGGDKYTAGDQPYVVSVTEGDNAQFYMPAQLDQESERRGILWWLLGGAAAVTGTYYITKDDNGPSS